MQIQKWIRSAVLAFFVAVAAGAFAACDTTEHVHDYVEATTTAATCTEKGLMTYTCACGDSYTEETPALGHDEETHQGKTPTCIEGGWAEYVSCRRSGCGYSTYEELPTNSDAHAWSDGEELVAPTCEEAGEMLYTCTLCRTATDTREIPALQHDKQSHNGKAATCEEDGWKAYETCGRSGCLYTTYETVPALGHDYVDKICKICSIPYYSQGLKYKLSADKSYWSVCGVGSCTDTDVVLPVKYKGLPVKEIAALAFSMDYDLTSVVIPEGITSIGAYAFDQCLNLQSIKIPNSVIEIGESAFTACVRLTNVDLGTGVQSIGYSAFSSCRALLSITLPASVRSIGDYAFLNCYRLVEVVSHSSEIVLEKNADTYGGIAKWALDVYNAGDTFVSKLSTDGDYVVHTDGAEKLVVGYVGNEVYLTLPSDITGVHKYAFYSCTDIVSVEIPASVVSIAGGAFTNCYKLVEVVNRSSHFTVKAGEKNQNGNVGLYALGVFNPGQPLDRRLVEDDGYILYVNDEERILLGYVGEETDLTLPKGITQIYQYAFYKQFNLTQITIPEGVSKFGDYAFGYCIDLTDVSIPASLKTVGARVFWENISLDKVHITDIGAWVGISCPMEGSDGSPLNWAKSGLYVNGELATKIVIPDGVEEIGNYVFCFYNALNSVVIPDSVIRVGERAFAGCRGLVSVQLGSGIETIGNAAFTGCVALAEVVNKSANITVEKGASTHGEVGMYALSVYNSGDTFTGTKISYENGYIIYTDGEEKVLLKYQGEETELVLPAGITKIAQEAFAYCRDITSVVIPDSVKTIELAAFYYCTALTDLLIGEGVTTIAEAAFGNCTNLKTLVLGSGVKTIARRAFDACNAIETIYYMSTERGWDWITKGNDNGGLHSATRYYYCETQPGRSGEFWHFNEEGVPVVWIF